MKPTKKVEPYQCPDCEGSGHQVRRVCYGRLGEPLVWLNDKMDCVLCKATGVVWVPVCTRNRSVGLL